MAPMDPAGTSPLCLPDYAGGSLVNLMSSLTLGLGAASPYPPLQLLPPQEVAAARHVLLLVVDGLGHAWLQRGTDTLRRHLRGAMTSVFPSTTASAIPTFLTGLAPQQHGLTGWHMYFREIGAIAAPLPFRLRTGRQALRAAGVSPAALLGLSPLCDRLARPCHVLAPQHIVHSDFNVALSGRARRHGYGKLAELFALLRQLLGESEPSYLYAYWPELDSLAHEHGSVSAPAAQALAELDAACAELFASARGSDSLIIVTADHGFIDTTPADTLDLEEHPQLRQTLRLPLCGEPRVAYAYVRPGHERQFEAYVEAQWAGRVLCLKRDEVLARAWLGPGAPHPALAERLGDYVLIAQGRTILRDWLLGEERYRHIGVHGGLSPAEMQVPLVTLHG
ncbi:putative AlkP superfamily pyrophosphatase or phosphodiesterase [Sulfuritortus calidifontis]|uniref:Putative AlkP superfamily pyrophosphatase or phosphodiesterase n=1 Tax=Sulfuritortus calidifontis TaxID=1914471 RepID=A0A4R3K0R3_9PROT|nr:nucleotide pyrophosphatase/phosphodiesterase family protein [Sulfuritortus calidifontis]TCS73445.1 putative AlkP superfamily pyrophosphatase or phosphodiesterase [Sulfuritortus calidifontis]